MVIFHKNFNKLEAYNSVHKSKSDLSLKEYESFKEAYTTVLKPKLDTDLSLKEYESFKEAYSSVLKPKLDTDLSLKEYESFKGRIEFSNFIELFNFEKNIYSDKQFKYSLISNNNKRLIPEFISATFSKLIYDGLIDVEIRTKLEQYLIAIMSNLDYRSYATLEQVKDELEKNKTDKTFYNILGTCPLSFGTDKFEIFKERIKIANKFVKEIYGGTFDGQVKMSPDFKFDDDTEKKIFKEHVKPLTDEGKIEINIKKNVTLTSKLTKYEITEIFSQIEDNIETNKKYNLVLFASTYHISKVAQEIEKYFYENTHTDFPQNIFLVGTEKFFDLITSSKLLNDQNKNNNELFVLKKMQSFLFEIFMHSLDRNRQK
jgi:hypothetical protein